MEEANAKRDEEQQAFDDMEVRNLSNLHSQGAESSTNALEILAAEAPAVTQEQKDAMEEYLRDIYKEMDMEGDGEVT